jgi:hypothetical protein
MLNGAAPKQACYRQTEQQKADGQADAIDHHRPKRAAVKRNR